MHELRYRPEIDGLRAIAVLAVMAYHVEPGLLPGGFVGVDVFFVISGYLITRLLHAEWLRSGRIDLAGFYARRAKRLLPAALLVILATLVLSVVVLGPLGPPLEAMADSALASLLFLANVFFQANTGDYFGGPSDQLPLLHLWSLAVEEQFYFLWPALLWWLLGRSRRQAIGALLLACGLSLLLAEYWLRVSPSDAFFQTPARFWELGLGGVVALSGPSRLPRRLWPWLAGIGLAAVLVACASTRGGAAFPGFAALPAVLGTSLVLAALHQAPDIGWVGRGLAARPMVVVGLGSYSLYLWHWPLLALDRAANLEPSTVGWRLGLCLLAGLLAWITYRWVESPLRRARLPAPRVLAVAAAAIALLAVVAILAGRLDRVAEDRAALMQRTINDRPADLDKCHFWLRSEVPGLKPSHCDSMPGKSPRIAIWGDSHALAWQPFAGRMGEVRGQSVARLTMDSCPPVANYARRHPDVPGHAGNCARLNALALDLLAAPGRFDTVILAWRWLPESAADGGTLRLPPGLEQALARLSDVPEILVMAPLPELRGSAPQCIASGTQSECARPREDFDRRAAPARVLLQELAQRHRNVTVVDPASFFCDLRWCPVMKDGYSLFWDDDHVSRTAAEAFASSYLDDPARYTLTAPGPVPLPP